jgi:hypothetical protein
MAGNRRLALSIRCLAGHNGKPTVEEILMTDDRTQDSPIQDQHPQPLEDKVAGILVQEEADLAGHDQPEVLEALRQRFADAGIAISEDELIEQSTRISASDGGNYSNG